MDKGGDPRIEQQVRPDGMGYDEWDTLGFKEARKLFVKAIKGMYPPLTVGLYGSWGSGKSEMIKALAEDLKGDEYLTLIFDAWKYRHEQNLALPLICALQREHLSKLEEAKDSAKKIITRAAGAMANQFLKQKIGVDIGEAKAAFQVYEGKYEHYKKYEDSVFSIENEYKEFISVLLKKTKTEKLIIFIDNLDRCLPDVVLNLLEDISNFLSISGLPCIYILAIDKRNVIEAASSHYPNFDGVRYLEKIIQTGLKMPLPQRGGQQDPGQALYSFMKRYERGKRYKAKSQQGDSRDQIFKSLGTVDGVFREHMLGNPRRIERFVNKLMLLEVMGLFDAGGAPEDVPVITFLLLINEYFPDVFDALREDADFKSLETFLSMSLQKDTPPSAVRREKDKPENRALYGNEVFLNAYCNENNLFFLLLKSFQGLAKVGDLSGKLKKMSGYLSYVG